MNIREFAPFGIKWHPGQRVWLLDIRQVIQRAIIRNRHGIDTKITGVSLDDPRFADQLAAVDSLNVDIIRA